MALSSSGSPLAACRAVTLRAGERTLVRGLDLELRAGERWALIGPNGAGKSTLLRTLAGLDAPSAGQIEVGGRAVHDWSALELAGLRALLADRWIDPFAVDVLQVVLGARYRFGGLDPDAAGRAQGQAQAALAEFDCAALAHRDVRGLSRGERQRVALATALAQDAPLLLLDEPTAHQDPGHARALLARLADHPERAICASLHDLDSALRFATHVVLLDGEGGWQAGLPAATIDEARLEQAFGARFERVDTARGPIYRVS